MKKITLIILAAALLLSGCGKTDKAADKKAAEKESTSVSDTQKKEKKKSESKAESDTSSVKDSEGNPVTSEDLAEMIDKANAEDTDEASRREILDEIDYILKQAEQNTGK